MDSVPAVAKIAELRLGIRNPTDDVRRGINMKAPFAAARRDMWAGTILWAGLSRSDVQALAAFFESMDGRVTAFGVPLAAGFASQYVAGSSSAAGTLSSIPAYGVDTVRISVSGSPILLPGTLVTFGAVDGTYQLCEVLSESRANGTTDIYIAPRIRALFTTTACTLGTVTGKFVLAKDKLDGLQLNPSYGTLSVDVMEAL